MSERETGGDVVGELEGLARVLPGVGMHANAKLARRAATELRTLRADGRKKTKAILDQLARADTERQLHLGSLAMLVEDGVITSGRARELTGQSVEEQRQHVREVLDPDGAWGQWQSERIELIDRLDSAQGVIRESADIIKSFRADKARLEGKRDEADDLNELAWGLIANVPDWDAVRDWRGAAERWRDRWFKTLPDSGDGIGPMTALDAARPTEVKS